MFLIILVKFLLICTIFEFSLSLVNYQPEQIHIAFGDNVSTIVITWSTIDITNNSLVEYGINNKKLNKLAKGKSAFKFIDGGHEKRVQYIHKVILSNLKPNTKYLYHCGSELGWSDEFWFITSANDTTTPIHVAIFGDMGNKNAKSLPYLQRESQQRMYDSIIHVGDFAYDLHSENGRVGDEFMRQIEPLAGYVPYMVCVGNHESKYNFSHYRARFNMPGGTDNLMYSFNLGPVHFIGFSTETYYSKKLGVNALIKQYNWLENDLKIANQPKNRKLRPWIITFGHRPMYCSNTDRFDCSHNNEIRVGLPITNFFGLEDLFYKYGVDVELGAHLHSYERFWPIYDYKVYNGSYDHPYTNPRAPVHIVTGSAGCQEGREQFIRKIPEWSAFHSQDYGYTRMKAFNKTHLYFEQVSVDKNGDIIDKFWVIKNRHGSYL